MFSGPLFQEVLMLSKTCSWRMVVCDAKSHQLLKRNLVVLVCLEDDRARIGETQALPHYKRGNTKSVGDC